MIKKSYAKINLAINVIERLPDDYHLLDMIMTKIDLYDKLYFSIFNEDKIHLTCTNPYIPVDERNLIYKVIYRFKKKYNINKGVRVHIAKTIPMQAGLGGGSSNAASTLDALTQLFNIKMSIEEKIALVCDLGADIPFFFFDGMARVKGVGDIILPFEHKMSDFSVILVKPTKGISTKQAYNNINLSKCAHPDIDKLIEALKNNDYNYLVNNIENSIQESSIEIRPIIKDIINQLIELKVDCTLVSGSGSTVFALTRNQEVVKNIRKSALTKKNFVYCTKIVR